MQEHRLIRSFEKENGTGRLRILQVLLQLHVEASICLSMLWLQIYVVSLIFVLRVALIVW